MGFKQAVVSGIENYANFRGRALRGEYWWFVLFNLIAVVTTQIVDAFITGGVLVALVGVGLVIPSISVMVRRLHDTDRSGWWFFISLVPLAGFVVLLVFLASRGTDGPNRFGAPRAVEA